MFSSLAIYALLAIQAYTVSAFPAYESLAGLSREELDAAVSSVKWVPPPPPPGPLADQSAKLVHDAAHPYEPLKPGDQRGPCPALNTLASHGVSDNVVGRHGKNNIIDDPHSIYPEMVLPLRYRSSTLFKKVLSHFNHLRS